MRECCAIRGCPRPATQTVTDDRGRVPNWHRMCGPHADEWAAERATTPAAPRRAPSAPVGPAPLPSELPYLLELVQRPARTWQALSDELGLTEGQSRWRRVHLVDGDLMRRAGAKKEAQWFVTVRGLAWLLALHPAAEPSGPVGPCALCATAARVAVGPARVCEACEPALEDALLGVAAEHPLPDLPRRWLDARSRRAHPARGRAA